MEKSKLYLETRNPRAKAKIGVILTSYGRDTMLKKAIESVLTQTLKDFILIIIDDNSPEINKKTQPIIQSYADSDDRIIYFRTDITPAQRKSFSSFCRNINNMLVYANNALDITYVCYLPCDDYFYPDKLQEITAFMDIRNQGLCWHYIDLVDLNGRKFAKVPAGAPPKVIKAPVAVLDHGCVVHRIEAITKLPRPYWPLEKYSEHQAPDGLFFAKLIKYNGGIFKTDTNRSLGAKTRHGKSIQGRVLGW